MLVRHHDWPELLAKFLLARRKVPFAWGSNDCGVFACDAVLEITGTDMAADLRGTYDTEEGAKAATGDLENYAVSVAERFGLREVDLKMAGRGDVVLWITELGPTLGIVSLDARYAAFLTPERLQHVRLLSCNRAWRIG